MRLDYNILCIDDEIETLRETKRILRAFNDQVGIKTNFYDVSVKPSVRETEPEPYKKRILEDIGSKFNEKSFELIMVDLHLGPMDDPMGFKGHEIIQFIRESQTMYRPIVFYSSGEPESDEKALSQLEEDIRDNDLIGKCIFLSSRGKALDRHLSGICKEMHDEEHKLNASRGLLMDRTSELDANVLAHLKSKDTWDELTADQADKLHNEIAKELRRKGAKARLNSCELSKLGNGDFKEFRDWIIESESRTIITALDSFARNKILRELLRIKPHQADMGKTHSEFFNNVGGQDSISKIRNDYAHQTEVQIGAVHNDERCKFIRDELRKHLTNMAVIMGKA